MLALVLVTDYLDDLPLTADVCTPDACSLKLCCDLNVVLTGCWVVRLNLTGIKESDTGLAPPALWDLAADKQTLQSEQPLQVAR